MYPWSPGPVTSGRSCSSDARYSAGPLLASWVGWWRRRAWNKKNKHRVPATYQEGDWVLVHHS